MSPFLLAQEHPPEEGGHGEGHGDAHEGAAGHAEINPMSAEHANFAAAIWALGIFLVLFLLLWKKAWGPIVAGLQAREDRINESLKRAEELEKATRELAETNRAAMDRAQQDAQQIVAEARVAAQKAASDVAAKANAEIEASRDRFQREMRLEAEKVKAEIRKDAVDMTLAATAKLIGHTLSSADHRKLAEQALRDAESVARN